MPPAAKTPANARTGGANRTARDANDREASGRTHEQREKADVVVLRNNDSGPNQSVDQRCASLSEERDR
jgi:hypothetical protein